MISGLCMQNGAYGEVEGFQLNLLRISQHLFIILKLVSNTKMVPKFKMKNWMYFLIPSVFLKSNSSNALLALNVIPQSYAAVENISMRFCISLTHR